MKFLKTIAVTAAIGLTPVVEAQNPACPTVTAQTIAPECGRTCRDDLCTFLSNIPNPCTCPQEVPTAHLYMPCNADCPYGGCTVLYSTLSEGGCGQQGGGGGGGGPLPTNFPTNIPPGGGGGNGNPLPPPGSSTYETTRWSWPWGSFPVPTASQPPQQQQPTTAIPSRPPPSPPPSPQPASPPPGAGPTVSTIITSLTPIPSPTRIPPAPTGNNNPGGPGNNFDACPTITRTTRPADCPRQTCPIPGCVNTEAFVLPCGCDSLKTQLRVEGCPTACPDPNQCAVRTTTSKVAC